MKTSLKTLALASLGLLTLTACSVNVPSVEQLLSKDKSSTTVSSQSSSASSTSASSAAVATISQEEAVKKALEILGVAQDQVDNLVVKKETEDGQAVYDVSFTYEDMAYEYVIDAQTGQPIEKEAEPSGEDDGDDDRSQVTGSLGQAVQAAEAALSSEEATAVAFSDFAQVYGVGADAVDNLLVESSTEDGRASYDISFDYDAYSFSYTVDAQTGDIIDFSEDDLY